MPAKPQEERLQAGVSGLDELLNGGFIKNQVYLISGGAGCGKTIICCQILWTGLQRGDKCIFFTLEEPPDSIIKNAKKFGWDLNKYIDQKKFLLEYKDPFEMVDITTVIKQKVVKFGATIVVIDSSSIIGMLLENQYEVRKRLLGLIKALKEANVTTFITSETLEGSESMSRFQVEEFVVDGVIALYFIKKGYTRERALEVFKMRGSKIAEKIVPMHITDKGIVLYPKQQIFNE